MKYIIIRVICKNFIVLILISMLCFGLLEAKTNICQGIEGGVIINIGGHLNSYLIGNRIGFEFNRYLKFGIDTRFEYSKYSDMNTSELMFGIFMNFYYCGGKLPIIDPYFLLGNYYGLSWEWGGEGGFGHYGYIQVGGGIDIAPARSSIKPFFEIGTFIRPYWTKYHSILIQGGIKFNL
jgi:hypothetical protein